MPVTLVPNCHYNGVGTRRITNRNREWLIAIYQIIVDARYHNGLRHIPVRWGKHHFRTDALHLFRAPTGTT